MAYVVTEACIKCKFMDCVDACPTEAFHAGTNFVVINPESCGNCSLCEIVCPVSAIFPRSSLPQKFQHYVSLNAELAKEWPKVTSKNSVPGDAEAWADISEKIGYLER